MIESHPCFVVGIDPRHYENRRRSTLIPRLEVGRRTALVVPGSYSVQLRDRAGLGACAHWLKFDDEMSSVPMSARSLYSGHRVISASRKIFAKLERRARKVAEP